jgi:C-terminal binding-module, SLH-like, of glucodextranase
MFNAVLAAGAILFSASDPQGDSLGDGSYFLPSARRDASQLDIRTFTALDNEGKLEVQIAMGRVQNQDRAPNGFSNAIIDVFIGLGRGGNNDLQGSGFSTSPNKGWYYQIRATPFTTTVKRDSRANSTDLPKSRTAKTSVDGANIIIKTDIPAGAYTYFVLSSLYDSLSPTGVAQPQNERSPLRLYSPIANAPSALDILYENQQLGLYATKEVPVLNEPKFETNPLLYTGIIGVALVLITTIWGLFNRTLETIKTENAHYEQ